MINPTERPRLTLVRPEYRWASIPTLGGGWLEISSEPGKPLSILIVEDGQRAAIDLSDAAARQLGEALG